MSKMEERGGQGHFRTMSKRKALFVWLPLIVSPPDNSMEFICQPGWTLGDLKAQFNEQEGIGVTRQTYFCGLYRLEDDSVLLRDLMNDTFRLDVELTTAGGVSEREFCTKRDTWLITGSRRNFDPPIKITPRRMERIRFPKGKFGIVTTTGEGGNQAGEEMSGPRYMVRRYQEERKGQLVLKWEGGETEVYIILDTGKEEKLEGVLMIYDENRRRKAMEMADVANIAGNSARLLTAIGGLIFEGRYN